MGWPGLSLIVKRQAASRQWQCRQAKPGYVAGASQRQQPESANKHRQLEIAAITTARERPEGEPRF